MIARRTMLVWNAILLVLLSACGGAAARPVPSNPSTDWEPEAPVSSLTEGEYQTIRVPSSPGVAPSDVFDQISIGGRGGPDGGAHSCPCISVLGNQVELSEFSAYDELRLVAYHYEGSDRYVYLGDWMVTVDSSGYLLLQTSGLSLSKVEFFALDPYSGKQIGPDSISLIPITSSSSSSSTARISSEVVEVNLRRSPGYVNKNDNSDVVVKIPSGQTVEIIGGPSSADGLTWWNIYWMGNSGWAADHTGSGRTILVFDD